MTQIPSQRVPADAARPAVQAYPANVTFHDLIRANKRKSALLMVGMSLLLVMLGAVFGGLAGAYAGGGDLPSLLPSIVLGLIAAGVTAIIASLWSFYGGSNAILKMSGAKELQRAEDVQLHNIVEEMSIAAGVPMPRVFVMNDTALNAFATGRDPQHAAVAITTGLRQQLSRDELAGVIAHEMSHVRHYDIRFAMLMATMVGLIVFACDAFWRVLRHGMWAGGRRSGGRSSEKGAGALMLVLLIVAVVLAIIAPMLAMVIRFAVSRQREYLADAGAVELTRDPQGLIGALKKLGACHEPLEAANRATAHLYIVNPLKSAVKGQGHELSSVFRTHPPLHERIARLEALIQQDRLHWN